MAVKISVKWDRPIDTEKDLLDLSKFMKSELIRIDREEVFSEENLGFDTKAKVKVDNRWNKPISLVNPFGRIEHHARVAPTEALMFIFNKIEELSPRRSGRYANYNRVYFEGKEVARSATELKLFLETRYEPSNKPFRFINGTPYARKLERFGVTSKDPGGGAKLKIGKSKRNKGLLQPNGTYYRTSRIAKSKYGQFGFIKFALFQNGSNGIFIAPPPGMGTTYKTGKTIGRPYLHPQILVYPFEEGILQ